MTTRPRIAIPVPTSFDAPYNAQSWPEYAAAVERSGGTALRVELGIDPREPESEPLDGILLPGSGADIDPALYGHPSRPETAPADPLRQAVDSLLLRRVHAEGIPLLAICFGLQSLNVYRGGTLIQHLAPVPINHRAGRPVLDAHAVVLTAGSKLNSLAAVDRTMVNSSHHQAIDEVGVGLRAAALSTLDNVVEAVEDPEHPWLVGVQWHPERTFEHSAFSQAIFTSFLQAASQPR